MTTKEVLTLSLAFMGKDELLDTNYFLDEGQEPTELQTKEINMLLRCLNLIVEEIACDYLPLIKTKQIEFSNFRYDITNLDPKLCEILAVKSLGGKALKYKIVDDSLFCQCNNAVVEYKVYPTYASLDGACENFYGKMPARVLAYGVCMEYLLISQCYDDAGVWENKFKNSLLVGARKKGELTLAKRGWF